MFHIQAMLILSGLALAEDLQTETVTFCAKTETSFTDDGGDFWGTNGARRLRGVNVRFIDAAEDRWVYMDDDGCKEIEITVDNDISSDYGVWLGSEAKLGSSYVFSWKEDYDGSNSTYAFYYQSFNINNLSPLSTVPQNNTDIRVWQNLALGVFALDRSATDFKMADHGNNSNCADTGIACCGYTDWSLGQGSMPDYQLNYVAIADGNYSSTWGPSEYGNGATIPAVTVENHLAGDRGKRKFSIAHETGHVIMHLRIGEGVARDSSAPEYGCAGSWYDSSMTIPANNKGLITREYEAMSIWEGWADFFAAWLFNNHSQSSCEYNANLLQDFDLDGDIDNDFTGTALDGSFSCEGSGLSPDFSEPVPTDPLATYVSYYDWLQDMYDNQSSTGCPSTASTTIGVSTKYDWLRYFWDLASDQDVNIDQIGTVFVDMCPSTWDDTTTGLSRGYDWPTRRWERSIKQHNLESEHNAECDNVGLPTL